MHDWVTEDLATFSRHFRGQFVAPISRSWADALFWNQSALKQVGSNIEAKFTTFYPTVKIKGGWAKCLSEFFNKFNLGTNVWYLVAGAPLRGLGS